MVDAHTCDLTNPAQVRAVFEKYGKGGIWGVIHVAVSAPPTLSSQSAHITLGVQSGWRVNRDSPHLLPQQRLRNHIPPSNHVRIRLRPIRIFLIRDRIRYPSNHTHSRTDTPEGRQSLRQVENNVGDNRPRSVSGRA